DHGDRTTAQRIDLRPGCSLLGFGEDVVDRRSAASYVLHEWDWYVLVAGEQIRVRKSRSVASTGIAEALGARDVRDPLARRVRIAHGQVQAGQHPEAERA